MSERKAIQKGRTRYLGKAHVARTLGELLAKTGIPAPESITALGVYFHVTCWGCETAERVARLMSQGGFEPCGPVRESVYENQSNARDYKPGKSVQRLYTVSLKPSGC